MNTKTLGSVLGLLTIIMLFLTVYIGLHTYKSKLNSHIAYGCFIITGILAMVSTHCLNM